MKRSLKTRITVYFAGLLAAALLAIAVFHLLFIDDIYRQKQVSVLIESYRTAQEIGDDFQDIELKRFCQMNGLTYIIADEELQYAISNSDGNEKMTNLLFMYILGLHENGKVLERGDHYTVTLTKDDYDEVEYLELWGILDNGCYYLVRSPLNSIREAAALSNAVYLFIGLIVLGCSLLLIFFLTRRLMKPISELTELSKKMAQLDFDARYQSGGEDEIGRLGENFNIMSKRLEENISELKTANARLEKDIEEKTQIDEMRREFLTNVSHDLKTPIALISGYAEGLKEMQLDDTERAYYCDVIIDESARMNRLVRSLLMLNELENSQDRIEFRRFDLMELIEGVVSSNRLLMEQNDIRVNITPEEPVFVWGDEFLIEQVVTNYLSNAIQHCEGERRIRIACERGDGFVTTTVFNTGERIPEESLEHVWERLYKVDKARTREYGGNGIGLSIVKAVMDLHRQPCDVRNVEDGVEFSFTLESKPLCATCDEPP